jgi:hypothetical protein
MQDMQVATAPTYPSPKEVKCTAVDSVNANIEVVTNKINTLANFAARISDGIIGVQPLSNPPSEPPVRPVSQSTQDYIRDLETAFERLSMQINRLG